VLDSRLRVLMWVDDPDGLSVTGASAKDVVDPGGDARTAGLAADGDTGMAGNPKVVQHSDIASSVSDPLPDTPANGIEPEMLLLGVQVRKLSGPQFAVYPLASAPQSQRRDTPYNAQRRKTIAVVTSSNRPRRRLMRPSSTPCSGTTPDRGLVIEVVVAGYGRVGRSAGRAELRRRRRPSRGAGARAGRAVGGMAVRTQPPTGLFRRSLPRLRYRGLALRPSSQQS